MGSPGLPVPHLIGCGGRPELQDARPLLLVTSAYHPLRPPGVEKTRPCSRGCPGRTSRPGTRLTTRGIARMTACARTIPHRPPRRSTGRAASGAGRPARSAWRRPVACSAVRRPRRRHVPVRAGWPPKAPRPAPAGEDPTGRPAPTRLRTERTGCSHGEDRSIFSVNECWPTSFFPNVSASRMRSPRFRDRRSSLQTSTGAARSCSIIARSCCRPGCSTSPF